MPASIRHRDRAHRIAAAAYRDAARELRDARLAANRSQRRVAHLAGCDQARISRTESAAGRPPRLDDLAAHAAAVGLRLSVKLYPDGSSVRDAGQLRLIERFRALVGVHFRWTAEAPIGAYGDRRAWDVRLDGDGAVGVDAETRIHDIQLLQRRTEMKLRDSDVDAVVLLIADTRHNRRVLKDHYLALATTFPLPHRRIAAALRAGTLPTGNGILVL